MTDYFKETGTNPNPDFKGSMMIRDTGTHIEFRIRAGSENTQHSAMPYGWTVNGSTGTATKPYPKGKKWLFLKSWPVSTSQTVTFRLFATGTEGLGGPTTFSVYIDRGTVPGKPGQPSFGAVTHTSLEVSFEDGSDGGLPITKRYLGWGTSASVAQTIIETDGSEVISGLMPGQLYYFWSRTENSKGKSDWSVRAQGRTLGGVRVRVGSSWKTAIPYVRHEDVWKVATPWVKVNNVWKRTL